MRLKFIIIVMIFLYSMPAFAVITNTLPVNLQQNNISWDQMQNVFASNPGISNFNFRFPNGSSWNVEEHQMELAYQNYTNQAQQLGYDIKSGNLPQLNFSALPGGGVVGKNSITIPIQNATNDIQASINNAVTELHNQGNGFFYSLPNWLQKLIMTAYTGFMVLFDFAVEEGQKLFGR